MTHGHDNVMELVARADPVTPEEVEARIDPARSEAVLAAVLAATPARRRRRWPALPARVVIPALVAAALALAAALLLPSLLPGGPQNALAIEKTDRFISLRIEDPAASPARMNRELRERGIDIEVEMVPVPEHQIGDWVGGRAVWPGVSGDQHRLGDDRIRRLNDAARLQEVIRDPGDPGLIRVRTDFRGHVLLYGGREARPGEEPWIDGNPPGAF
jgi:hypothetical protein